MGVKYLSGGAFRELKKMLPKVSEDEWYERKRIAIDLDDDEIQAVLDKMQENEKEPYFDYTTLTTCSEDEFDDHIDDVMTSFDERLAFRSELFTILSDK